MFLVVQLCVPAPPTLRLYRNTNGELSQLQALRLINDQGTPQLFKLYSLTTMYCIAAKMYMQRVVKCDRFLTCSCIIP